MIRFGTMNFPNRITHMQRKDICFSSCPASRNIPFNPSKIGGFPARNPGFSFEIGFILT